MSLIIHIVIALVLVQFLVPVWSDEYLDLTQTTEYNSDIEKRQHRPGPCWMSRCVRRRRRRTKRNYISKVSLYVYCTAISMCIKYWYICRYFPLLTFTIQ